MRWPNEPLPDRSARSLDDDLLSRGLGPSLPRVPEAGWGVALRGQGLGMKDVGAEELQDCPDEALPSSVGAFRMGGVLYKVPDLLELQRSVRDDAASAACETVPT